MVNKQKMYELKMKILTLKYLCKYAYNTLIYPIHFRFCNFGENWFCGFITLETKFEGKHYLRNC